MTEQSPDYDAHFERHELIGRQVMYAMTCTHYGSDAFGPGAVCETCFDNTQRIGALIERYAAQAWGQGRAAERDEDRRPMSNPYRDCVIPPETSAADD